jgi:hypothetical protein
MGPESGELGPDLCLNMEPVSETGSRCLGDSYPEIGGVCLLLV